MTIFNSGYKQVDVLVKHYDISPTPTKNPFQLSVEIPVMEEPNQLADAISPFGLYRFPNTMWLALQRLTHRSQALLLHRFSLPANNQVICWALLDIEGGLLEKAFPMNKPKYVKAANTIISHLVAMPYCKQAPLPIAG